MRVVEKRTVDEFSHTTDSGWAEKSQGDSGARAGIPAPKIPFQAEHEHS